MGTILRNVSRYKLQILSTGLQKGKILNHTAFISTSNEKKDVHTAGPEIIGDPKKFENWNVPENWISYEYDYSDKEKDRFYRNLMQHVIFGSIMWTSFITLYKPDFRLRNHSRREAFLELERRRNAGLPLIDPNLVDPETVILPTDEELGPDFEIII